MNIKILGNGVWGNALFSVLVQNDSSVQLLKRGEKATMVDLVVLAVPTQSIRDALTAITFSDTCQIIVNTAKGIEEGSHLLPHQIVSKIYGDNIDYYSLVGPSFAKEVVDKMPTLVNLGYKKASVQNSKVKDLFQTDFFRVKLTKSFEVLEISAAFKNIYAIACGLASGLGYGTNTRVKLMVLAMEEMVKLYHQLHLQVDAHPTAGTIGDLILTCNSTESRNFTFGTLLAKYSVEDALHKVNSTVEGLHSMNSVAYFEKLGQIELPLARFIKNVVSNNDPVNVKTQFKNFICAV